MTSEIPSSRGLFDRAFELSRQRHGSTLSVHVPGMFCWDGVRGRYPAISVTGPICELQCDHCRGRLLKTLPVETTPEGLIARCRRLDAEGFPGVLLTGGCDRSGRLPWPRFADAIEAIRRSTSLFLSFHAGVIDRGTAQRMKDAGAHQALLDVAGSDATIRRVFHLEGGRAVMAESLDALAAAGLDTTPHIILGLDGADIREEYGALDLIDAHIRPSALAVVIRMPLADTPLMRLSAPQPDDVGLFLATARMHVPDAVLSLGCARPRHIGAYERVAVDAGVNRIALASEETLAYARKRGLTIRREWVCCSVPDRYLEHGKRQDGPQGIT